MRLITTADGVEPFDDQIADPIEERHFLEAGHRRRQLDLPLGLLRNRVTEHARDARLRVVDVAARFEAGVNFETAQSRVDLTFAGAERLLEDVGRRMRRVRRHEQHAPALTACRERHGGGAGRLANTTLPAEEEDSLAKERNDLRPHF